MRCLISTKGGILNYRHSIVPSFNTSIRSPFGIGSPSVEEIQLLTAAAASGVYFERLERARSLSREATEAMVVRGRVGRRRRRRRRR
jgi:hypothetical protein